MELIATAVGNSSSVNIEFTNIPQTYQFLKVVGIGRTAAGSGGSNAWIGAVVYFNGSTSYSNVIWRRMIAYNNNNWILDTNTGPDLQANGTATTSGYYGVATWWCNNYSATDKWKSFGSYASGTNGSAGSSYLNATVSGQYQSNAAISSLRFDFSFGLDPNTVYKLYGING
jgi:hypothetical protein